MFSFSAVFVEGQPSAKPDVRSGLLSIAVNSVSGFCRRLTEASTSTGDDQVVLVAMSADNAVRLPVISASPSVRGNSAQLLYPLPSSCCSRWPLATDIYVCGLIGLTRLLIELSRFATFSRNKTKRCVFDDVDSIFFSFSIFSSNFTLRKARIV